jgi:DNA-entry nuclease
MLPFENMVADYVKETDNHVMYRVTPIYDGRDLVACGVQLEAYSVEDEGDGICFNVYVYNVQPGIVIDYATGENWIPTETPKATETTKVTESIVKTYVLNTNTKKIHLASCRSAGSISESNRDEYTGDIQDLISDGYSTCGICKPAA